MRFDLYMLVAQTWFNLDDFFISSAKTSNSAIHDCGDTISVYRDFLKWMFCLLSELTAGRIFQTAKIVLRLIKNN